MKHAFRNIETGAFRISAPPESERDQWEKVLIEDLEPAERTALKIDQLNEDFISRHTKLEKEVDQLKAQLLERAVTGEGEPAKVKPISLCRLFRAIGSNDWGHAEHEREVVRSDRAQALRALGADVDTSGGYMVPPEYMPAEFIELLRANTVIDKVGARMLMNLQGAPLMIPKQTGGATAYWVGENAEITESAQTTGQLNLVPHELAALSKMSNKFLLQSDPSAEAFVREDLAKVLGLKLDLGALKGSGASGEPLGIFGTAGVNTSTATGAIVNTIFDMKHECEVDNVDMNDPSAALVCHPTGWNKLRKLVAAAGTPKMYAGVGYKVVDEACDMKSFKTSQLGTADCLVGKFDDLIVANWAGILFKASEHAGDAFAYNQTWIRAIMLVDIGVRNPVSFCVNTVFGT